MILQIPIRITLRCSIDPYKSRAYSFAMYTVWKIHHSSCRPTPSYIDVWCSGARNTLHLITRGVINPLARHLLCTHTLIIWGKRLSGQLETCSWIPLIITLISESFGQSVKRLRLNYLLKCHIIRRGSHMVNAIQNVLSKSINPY